jgi:hypothetical protein
MKPICFTIIWKKATQAEAGQGVATIDFDALWHRAYALVGYDPVRADQDVGALIITQMIERVYFADLVWPNDHPERQPLLRGGGSPRGARKGLRPARGRLVETSKQLFDVAQMRTIRYPLADGGVGEAAADARRTPSPSPARASRLRRSPSSRN